MVGPILFVATFLIEGATRPGYNPVRQFVSALSLGDGGSIQAANFIVSGLLIAAFGVGARRLGGNGGSRWLPRLIVLAGLGLVWAGLFPSDPQGGYPAWIPMEVANNLTWHARLHFIGGVTVVSALPLAIVTEGRRATAAGQRVRARYAWASAAVAVGSTAIGLALGGVGGEFAWAGLVQRVSFIAALQWLATFAAAEVGPSTASGG